MTTKIIKDVAVHIRVGQPMIEKIDRIVDHTSRNRSQVVRALIVLGLKDYLKKHPELGGTK